MSTHQWIAIRLPDLPCNALDLQTTDIPQAVIEQKQVVWLNRIAMDAGAHQGMNATRAQLLSGCALHPRNPVREIQLLNTLRDKLYAFTPHLELRQSSHIAQAGLLLEISSCLTLFGGFAALVRKLQSFLRSESITSVLAAGYSSESAWVLSFGQDTIDDNFCVEDIKNALMAVPIQWLHDFPKEISALEKMGFVTLGDIARQIAAQQFSSIRKRFGQSFTDYLSKLFGVDWDFQQPSLFTAPLITFQPQDYFRESLEFDYPIHNADQLYSPMEQLLKHLAKYLHRHQWQTKHIHWIMRDIYRNQDLIRVDVDQPQSDWQLLFDLTCIQLENRELIFETDTLELVCEDTQPLEAPSQALQLAGSRKNLSGRDFIVTSARLKARLGDAAVFKVSYANHHLPEHSTPSIELAESSNQSLPQTLQHALRPTWLLDSPVPLEERKQGLYWRGYLTLLRGPERIQGYWWQKPTARDYFLARRHDNLHVWIYQDLHTNAWYVHGIFG